VNPETYRFFLNSFSFCVTSKQCIMYNFIYHLHNHDIYSNVQVAFTIIEL